MVFQTLYLLLHLMEFVVQAYNFILQTSYLFLLLVEHFLHKVENVDYVRTFCELVTFGVVHDSNLHVVN